MSSFGRQPVLNHEEEAKLKPLLEALWNDPLRYTAGAIAEKLQFGVKGTEWEKLAGWYFVYYYRSKFSLVPRQPEKSQARKGKTRYKVKQSEMMQPEMFLKGIEAIPSDNMENRRKRAYLILHYWTPLRKSEIYERKGGDFEMDSINDVLVIHLIRKKKGRDKPRDEPLAIPLGFPLMKEVIDWIRNEEWKTGDNKRVFNISSVTAWKCVKEVFKDYYPHFFRFNYITDGFDDPDTTLAEMKAKTGLSVQVLDRYVMTSKGAQSRFDSRKLERLQKRGTV